MKNFFVVTYYIYMFSDNGTLSDYFEDFYFWKTPIFNDWIYKKRIQHQDKYNVRSVVVNCGKY